MYRKAFLVAVLLVLIAVGAAWWVRSAPAPSASAPALSADLSPLYTGAQWNAPAAEALQIGTTTYAGAGISSAPIPAGMNPGAVLTPFEQYYDQKLGALGWAIDTDLAAGGATGGQAGYTKDGKVILTRYAIAYQNVSPDAPLQCPCTVTLSLFSASI